MHKRLEKVTLWVAGNDYGGIHQTEALDYVLPLLEDDCEIPLVDYESERWTMVKDDSPEPEPVTLPGFPKPSEDSSPAKPAKKTKKKGRK